VAAQREVVHLGYGGGSSKTSVARTMGHCFYEICPYGCIAARGTHLGGPRAAGATGVRRVTVVGLPQPTTSSMMSSNGRPAMRLGKAGAV
jgi:hypothetical protein